MKTFNRQPSKKAAIISKRVDKKRVNIKWNSVRVFQVGLIACILVAFGVVNMSFTYKDVGVTSYETDDFLTEISIGHVVPEIIVVPKAKPKEIRPREKQQKITDVIKVEKNTATISENPIASTTPVIDTPVVSGQPTTIITKAPVSKTTTLLGVENVPVFPGCESQPTRDAKIACMSSKIGNYVSKNFRGDNFNHLETNKKHTIYVQFTIDKNGSVTNTKARALDKGLEKEATRVINKLPTITPGKQGNKEVAVIYSIPIVFQLSN